MKTKQIGRKILALFLSATFVLNIIDIPTFALGTTNFIGGYGNYAGGNSSETGTKCFGDADGIRVTLVDASSGKRVSGTKSVDYSMATASNGQYYCDFVMYDYGMKCKSEYYLNGSQVGSLPAIPIGGGYKAKQPSVNADEFQALGSFIHWGDGVVDMKAVKKYFTNVDVQRMICINTGFCTDEEFETEFLANMGEYRLMLEPVGYFDYNDGDECAAYAMTATEMALFSHDTPNDQGVVGSTWYINCYLTYNAPISLYLEKDMCGYKAPTTTQLSLRTEDNPGGKLSSGAMMTYADWDFCVSTLGLGFVSFADDGDLYYHIFSEQREPTFN